MCYCLTPESIILKQLQDGSLPEDALVKKCCWRTICKVRGKNLYFTDPEIWSEICHKRGYLLYRQNSRGF